MSDQITYLSTRGGVEGWSFEDVLLAGLAPDGGLFVPSVWPMLSEADLADLRTADYPDVCAAVVTRFTGDTFSPAEIQELTSAAYRSFHDPQVAPLRDLGYRLHVLELFWGPTFSFKDFALQLLGQMIDLVLSKRGERLTIVGATSGDTGSAAIAALANRESVDIVILHPAGRVSDVQRRQMTTVDAGNVHNLAIDGTFDDCQDLVKAMFADETFRSDMRLSAVNSINFGRIMAQVAYYVWAYLRLNRRPFSVAVPTGNFGNAYAAYVASAMGIPIESIIVGNNANHGVSRLISTGSLSIQDVVPTIAPAMDIAVPSNFERLLFDILGRDAQLLASTMADFRDRGVLNIPGAEMAGVTSLFRSAWMSDSAIEGYMGELFRSHGVIVDPHTAIGIAAARMRSDMGNTPVVAVATAHPAKFADSVESATGVAPDIPPALAGISELPERYVSLPADLAVVEAHIRSVTGSP